MNRINYKIGTYILVGIVVIVFIINYFVLKEVVNWQYFFDSFLKAATAISIATICFFSWLWRFRIFQKWLVLIPNLNGIWIGEIHSDWINPKTNERVASKNVKLTIKQSLFNISCSMETDEMKSTSVCSGFNIDKNNQIKQLIYTYLSTPNQNIQARSRMHNGSIIFDINESNDKMTGNYWTGRNTTGTIKINKE